MLVVASGMGHIFLNAVGDALHVETRATPEGVPVKLTDESGREIGTAMMVDGRIHATVTDQLVIQRLRQDHGSISMGYRVVIKPEPAKPGKIGGG